MTYILDAPNGPAAMKRAACHEIRRRLGRFFQRNVVIAFEEWRASGGVAPFNYNTFCGPINEQHTDELLDYYQLLVDEECAIQGPQGDPGPQGEPGTPGLPYYPFIAYGDSEAASYTTSASWQQKLRVSFTATLGVQYKITWYFEMYAVADEDVEVQVELDDTNQVAESKFRNPPFANRWAQCNGGFYFADNLSGNVDVDIDYKSGFGVGQKGIRRARLIITRVDEAPP